MTYNWKALQEVLWAVAVGVIAYLNTTLALGVPADKAAWIALGAGAARAALAAVVAWISSRGSFQVS